MFRRYLLTATLVVPAALHAQIALVQVTSCGPQIFPTSTCSITSTGAGHLIVVGIQIGSGVSTSTTIATVTDNAGNAYAEANSTTSVLSGGTSSRSVDAGSGSVVDIWYARNSVAGATSLTITPSATISTAGAVIWEFSGVNTTAPLDQVVVLNSQAASANPTGASVTTALANEVVISLAAVSGSISGLSGGTAFTSDSALKSNGWAHLITTSPGTFAPQWSQSPSGTFASSTVTFKAANATPAFSACDLNQDGAVNVVDVQFGTNMHLSQTGQILSGQTGYRTCTANIIGPGVCTSTTDSTNDFVMVDQLRTATLGGGACATASSHSVLLNWAASSTSGVNYNVYRSTTSSSFSTSATPSASYRITSTPIAGLSYIDGTVFAGQTYYYAVTAVNSGGESYASGTAIATTPFP